MLIAPLCMQNFLTIAPAVLQMDLHVYPVATFVSERLEFRIFKDLDFLRRLYNGFAADRSLRDLIDEKLTIMQQNGDAEREIHLGRSHAVRFVGPTDVE